MIQYRLYFLDEQDHISRAIDLERKDDEDARALIEQYRRNHDLELWQGARFVGRFQARRERA